MTRDRNEMVVLDRAECLRRLGDNGVGRLAVTVGALPTIFPVNYAVTDGDVVFRTTRGTKLAAAARDAVVAFEVDDFDRLSHTGWSVVVVGPSREITDPAEIALAERLPLTRWATGGGAESVVRLRADLVSGRELTHAAPGQRESRNRLLPIDTCPQCGGDDLCVVTDGELTNIACLACFGCWHYELGVLHQLPASTCPGCSLGALCRAAHVG